MTRAAPVSDELSDLLQDCLRYRVFAPNSPDAAIAKVVAVKGLRNLSKEERYEWELRVLPVVSLPVGELLKRAHL